MKYERQTTYKSQLAKKVVIQVYDWGLPVVVRHQGELKTSSQLVDTWIRVNDPSAGSPTER